MVHPNNLHLMHMVLHRLLWSLSTIHPNSLHPSPDQVDLSLYPCHFLFSLDQLSSLVDPKDQSTMAHLPRSLNIMVLRSLNIDLLPHPRKDHLHQRSPHINQDLPLRDLNINQDHHHQRSRFTRSLLPRNLNTDPNHPRRSLSTSPAQPHHHQSINQDLLHHSLNLPTNPNLHTNPSLNHPNLHTSQPQHFHPNRLTNLHQQNRLTPLSHRLLVIMLPAMSSLLSLMTHGLKPNLTCLRLPALMSNVRRT